MTAWLDIVGIGEDGVAGLAEPARDALAAAEVIVGGDRHHDLAAGGDAERISWPSPFDALIETLVSMRGRRVVVLVTGDPLWYSVGARILKGIEASEITFHPQISAFQLAACRMGWSLADCATLTVHGRPVEQAVPFFAPGARLLILTQGRQTPGEMARLLRDAGYGASAMTVLAAMGGPREARFDGIAERWDAEVPDFHLLAVACEASDDAPLMPGFGLPDDAFEHDGKMTKSEMRAVTLAALCPVRGQLLWDVGLGCGSVAIEWMRAARDMAAVGLEPKAERRAMAGRNAMRLGAPRLEILEGSAPESLAGLAAPDAVFIGGGLSEAVVDIAMARLKPHGRLVANVVTLESEALLLEIQKRHGGALRRLAVSRAEPVGPYRGWRSAMPVTQWVWQK